MKLIFISLGAALFVSSCWAKPTKEGAIEAIPIEEKLTDDAPEKEIAKRESNPDILSGNAGQGIVVGPSLGYSGPSFSFNVGSEHNGAFINKGNGVASFSLGHDILPQGVKIDNVHGGSIGSHGPIGASPIGVNTFSVGHGVSAGGGHDILTQGVKIDNAHGASFGSHGPIGVSSVGLNTLNIGHGVSAGGGHVSNFKIPGVVHDSFVENVVSAPSAGYLPPASKAIGVEHTFVSGGPSSHTGVIGHGDVDDDFSSESDFDGAVAEELVSVNDGHAGVGVGPSKVVSDFSTGHDLSSGGVIVGRPQVFDTRFTVVNEGHEISAELDDLEDNFKLDSIYSGPVTGKPNLGGVIASGSPIEASVTIEHDSSFISGPSSLTGTNIGHGGHSSFISGPGSLTGANFGHGGQSSFISGPGSLTGANLGHGGHSSFISSPSSLTGVNLGHGGQSSFISGPSSLTGANLGHGGHSSFISGPGSLTGTNLGHGGHSSFISGPGSLPGANIGHGGHSSFISGPGSLTGANFGHEELVKVEEIKPHISGSAVASSVAINNEGPFPGSYGSSFQITPGIGGIVSSGPAALDGTSFGSAINSGHGDVANYVGNPGNSVFVSTVKSNPIIGTGKPSIAGIGNRIVNEGSVGPIPISGGIGGSSVHFAPHSPGSTVSVSPGNSFLSKGDNHGSLRPDHVGLASLSNIGSSSIASVGNVEVIHGVSVDHAGDGIVTKFAHDSFGNGRHASALHEGNIEHGGASGLGYNTVSNIVFGGGAGVKHPEIVDVRHSGVTNNVQGVQSLSRDNLISTGQGKVVNLENAQIVDFEHGRNAHIGHGLQPGVVHGGPVGNTFENVVGQRFIGSKGILNNGHVPTSSVVHGGSPNIGHVGPAGFGHGSSFNLGVKSHSVALGHGMELKHLHGGPTDSEIINHSVSVEHGGPMALKLIGHNAKGITGPSVSVVHGSPTTFGHAAPNDKGILGPSVSVVHGSPTALGNVGHVDKGIATSSVSFVHGNPETFRHVGHFDKGIGRPPVTGALGSHSNLRLLSPVAKEIIGPSVSFGHEGPTKLTHAGPITQNVLGPSATFNHGIPAFQFESRPTFTKGVGPPVSIGHQIPSSTITDHVGPYNILHSGPITSGHAGSSFAGEHGQQFSLGQVGHTTGEFKGLSGGAATFGAGGKDPFLNDPSFTVGGVGNTFNQPSITKSRVSITFGKPTFSNGESFRGPIGGPKSLLGSSRSFGNNFVNSGHSVIGVGQSTAVNVAHKGTPAAVTVGPDFGGFTTVGPDIGFTTVGPLAGTTVGPHAGTNVGPHGITTVGPRGITTAGPHVGITTKHS